MLSVALPTGLGRMHYGDAQFSVRSAAVESSRWLARAALLAYLLAALVGINGAAQSSSVTAALETALTGTVVALALVWVTTTGARRPIVLAGGVLSAVALVVAFLLTGAAFAAFAVPVLVAAGAAAHHRWRRTRLYVAPPETGAEPTLGAEPHDGPVVLIVNPRSGDGAAERAGLVEHARSLGVEVVLLEEGGNPGDLARDAAGRGASVLGVAGGDGSIGAVAEVAIEHDLPLLVVPAGTRNHLALDLGLDRTDLLAALAAVTDPEERRIDVGTVNGRVFVNNLSFGVYAALVDQAGYRDAKLPTLLETLPALWAEGGPWFDLAFDVPGHGHLDQAPLLQISNNTYELSGDFGRRGSLDDGALGLLTVDPDRLADLVALAALTAVGKAEASAVLWSWSGDHLRIDSGQDEVVVGVDGERVGFTPPIEVAIRPGALRVVVPAGTAVGLAEQTGGSPHLDLLSAAIGLGGPDT